MKSGAGSGSPSASWASLDAAARATDTAARSTPETRPHDPGRAWYRFAARLFPADPGRWVDLGCGQGELLAPVRPSGASPPTPAARRPIALDLAAANAAASRARGAAGMVADLGFGLPFADRCLDGAALIEVIEHLPAAEQLVDELARVLRPGAWLLVTTPNVAHWTYRWRALTGHPPKQEGYHFRFFTQRTLRRCLESRGFRIEARASFGKQALLTKLARAAGRDRRHKVRYRVPRLLEPLLAQHFVWLLVRDRDRPAD